MEIYNGNWTVYVHINKINQKIYVGITSKSLQERFRSNGVGYRSCSHFWHAIQKYGWKAFEHEVIASNLTEEEACNMEKLLIKKLNTTDQRYGYNISEGGDKGCLLTGERHPRYGKHLTAEHKRKLSESHKGKSVVMTESAKEKIRKALTGNKNGKRVMIRCIQTNVVYESAAEAAKDMNCDPSAILKCTKGELRHTHGLQWEKVS